MCEVKAGTIPKGKEYLKIVEKFLVAKVKAAREILCCLYVI